MPLPADTYRVNADMTLFWNMVKDFLTSSCITPVTLNRFVWPHVKVLRREREILQKCVHSEVAWGSGVIGLNRSWPLPHTGLHLLSQHLPACLSSSHIPDQLLIDHQTSRPWAVGSRSPNCQPSCQPCPSMQIVPSLQQFNLTVVLLYVGIEAICIQKN